MKWCIGLCTTAILARLLTAPCAAGEVEDYLTKDGTLKASITIQHSAYDLVPMGGYKYKGELCVIEPTGEWTRKTAATKGKLSAKQLAALAQHLAAQDFNTLPIHLGYKKRAIHDGYFVRIAFGKKAAYFNLEKPGDSRTDYLPKPGDPKAAAWSRFVALELFLTDMLRVSESKVDEKAGPPVQIQEEGKKTDPPLKPAPDPFEILRKEGREISIQNVDGKEKAMPKEKKAVFAIGALLEEAKTYSFTVTAKGVADAAHVEIRDLPGKERNIVKNVGKNQWLGDHWYGHRVVPLILKPAMTTAKGGNVRVLVHLDKETEFELYSESDADGIFLLQCLGLHKHFAAWIDKAVPKNSPDVVILKTDNPFPQFASQKLKPKDVQADTEELRKVVETAQEKYNEKRAELIKRMSRSYLYYAPAGRRKEWRLSAADDRLFVHTGCNDRMFAASFEVEFRLEKGRWHNVGIQAAEWFKGE